MDRRTFLLGVFALAGCAQARPTGPDVPRSLPAASGTPALVIGGDQTPAGTMLNVLLAGAVAGSGVAELDAGWRQAIGAGAITAAPVYAATARAELSESDEPSDDVVGDLAGLVQPDVALMSAGQLDGGLVWRAPAGSPVTSLAQVAKSFEGKTVAVPSFAAERSDGLPGLSVIYRAKVNPVVVDEPIARAALVATGTAAFGVFRRTDYLGTDALGELDDPSGMAIADPIVLAVNAAFADADPNSVLALNAVLLALTGADLVSLQQQVVGGSDPTGVARKWLVGKGLVR